LKLTLDDVTYRSGVDIQPEDFYRLLEDTDSLPITSTPSPGEFLEIYDELVKEDPEILSIHISSGLSGTFNSAVNAAKQVLGGNVTLVDTRTLLAGGSRHPGCQSQVAQRKNPRATG
jgi:DegV family protein with EDD domain